MTDDRVADLNGPDRYICAYGCGEVDGDHMHVAPRPRKPRDKSLDDIRLHWEAWCIAEERGMKYGDWVAEEMKAGRWTP